MSNLSSPDVENLVTQLTPMARQIATDKREFIIDDLDVSILIKPGLEIVWPIVVDNVPTMLRVSIDLMLNLLSNMQPSQVQSLLQNHRVYKATHSGDIVTFDKDGLKLMKNREYLNTIATPRNISTDDAEHIFHDG